MIHSIVSQNTIDETGAAFEAAVKDRKFSVLSIHNLKEKMNSRGVTFNQECRIYEVCHPGQAQRVLEANMEISTALPCRVSIYTEGNTVKLATIKPTVMLGMYDNKELVEVAEVIEKILLVSMEIAAKKIEVEESSK